MNNAIVLSVVTLKVIKLINTLISLFFGQAIDIFMSSCTVFVFLSLIEYAFVNVMVMMP